MLNHVQGCVRHPSNQFTCWSCTAVPQSQSPGSNAPPASGLWWGFRIRCLAMLEPAAFCSFLMDLWRSFCALWDDWLIHPRGVAIILNSWTVATYHRWTRRGEHGHHLRAMFSGTFSWHWSWGFGHRPSSQITLWSVLWYCCVAFWSTVQGFASCPPPWHRWISLAVLLQQIVCHCKMLAQQDPSRRLNSGSRHRILI